MTEKLERSTEKNCNIAVSIRVCYEHYMHQKHQELLPPENAQLTLHEIAKQGQQIVALHHETSFHRHFSRTKAP